MSSMAEGGDKLRDVRDRLGAIAGAASEGLDPAAEAVAVAELLQSLIEGAETPEEARAQARLARMMEDPSGRLFTTAITDQALRAHTPARVAEQLGYLLERYGVPRFMTRWERMQLWGFRALGPIAPGLLVPVVLRRVRREMAQFLLPQSPAAVSRKLARQVGAGAAVNLNHLGEAIVGEEEAERRVSAYLESAKRPDLASLSVKVSSITSQLNLLALDETLAVLSERLRALYRVARAHPYTGGPVEAPKLVTLDMEEYRDLHLTVALFRRVLDEPEFRDMSAGIVLQAYLPDSAAVQRTLTQWARARVAAGGAPIRLRLVKGANLAMERVEASLSGWRQAPYRTKAEVDANFKRMLEFATLPDNAACVRLGVGSHNLFDLALTLVLRAQCGVSDVVGFEMLEGIAGPLQRLIQSLTGQVLVYGPSVSDAEISAAIAYLIRRLDENTADENFLRHSFGLRVGTPTWHDQAGRFRDAWEARARVSVLPRRTGDRRVAPVAPAAGAPFANEADTDWALPQNRDWVLAATRRWREPDTEPLPLRVAGQWITETSAGVGAGSDPSRADVTLYRYVKADLQTIDLALYSAGQAQVAWGERTPAERSLCLAAVAQGLREARGRLIGAMVADGGKAIWEGDAEISEAVDFAEYYRRSAEKWYAEPDLTASPLGVVLVVSPWNFPLAIPAGGVLAALAAGNAVILKPSRQTVLVAHELCQVLWEAGVPPEVLQFVACDSDPVGKALVADERVDAVILTGGTETARKFLSLRPDLYLLAETGGKNATIVTELADTDLAIKTLMSSAFGHSGQKCSATSLLICEARVYDDAAFMARLADATRSLPVGSAWEPKSKVTPLIRAPSGDLAWALNNLEQGESWLVAPAQDPDNPRLFSPGVKLGVTSESRSHMTEFFGPVLSVMRAEDLEHAIQLANQTPYGLTAGLQSLDSREQERFIATIDAGCCYVNRGTTGAIVRRQPFGGRKASVWGPGAKAGGPNYVAQLMRLVDAATEEAKPDYAEAYDAHFAEAVDPSQLLGQDNFFRYQPIDGLLVRLAEDASEEDVARAVSAAVIARVRVELSAARPFEWLGRYRGGWTVVIERADELAKRLSRTLWERVRVIGTVESEVVAAGNLAGVYCEAAPVSACGRLELLRYLREQTLSVDYHRFGNLGEREAEARAPIE